MRAVDIVAGPLPRRLGPASPPAGPAPGQLAARAALWGLALGLLAPATTALVLVSGLAAREAHLVGSTDLGFFLGFVPFLAALVVTLLALVHRPLRDLRDLRAWHRELAVGLLMVGTVALAGLRAHGAEVTGDRWDAGWLFANGSLVLHVLVTWCLVRAAVGDLSARHARHAGWRPGPAPADEIPPPGPARAPAVAAGARPVVAAARALAWDAPRHLATLALAFRSAVGGVIVGTAAGAAAGTVVVPGVGTLAGGYLGAIYGLVPTAAGTAAVVTVVSWRRDTDPAAIHRAVGATLAAVGVAVLAGAWPLLHSAGLPATELGDRAPRAWLAGAVVVVLLLRRAVPDLATTYTRLVPATGRRSR